MPNSRQVAPTNNTEQSDEEASGGGGRSSSNNNCNVQQQAASGDNNGAVPGAVGGAGGGSGSGGGRPRDENSLSFKHFLQPHSDVVPQPAPTRLRGSRGPLTGSVDLVDMTMGLPDFVQDHLVLESLAGGDNPTEASEPRRVSHGGSIDLNVLNNVLPEFGPSQRNPLRVSQGTSRRVVSGQDQGSSNAESHHTHGAVALPDFLSDGPMQLNHNDTSINNSPVSSSTSRSARCRSQFDSGVSSDQSNRGGATGFIESTENLRLELERLRNELAEKNCRLSQLETELDRTRGSSNGLEASLRVAENALADANRRVAETERDNSNLKKKISALRQGNNSLEANENQSVGVSSSSSGLTNGFDSPQRTIGVAQVLDIASSSEILIRQLMAQMADLKKLASDSETKSNPTKKENS